MAGPSPRFVGDLSFTAAQTNLLQSIQQYRSLKNSFVPNEDARDTALKNAIQNATTWTQLGVLGTQLSPRFALLQKSIGSLGSSYITSIAPRFDEGTVGWYWTYGTNMDVSSAYLVCIFRYPTAKHSTAAQTFYNVFGYVVNGGKTLPFSSLGYPIMCPGSFTSTSSPDKLSLVMDVSMYKDDPNVALSGLSFSGTASTLKNMSVNITLKGTASPQYSASLNSAIPAAFEGKNGCAPCVDGAGFNYWSFTYLTGSATGGFSSTAPLIGWFDHQWLQPLPKSSFSRALMTFGETTKAPSTARWVFLTLQPDASKQYMVFRSFSLKDVQNAVVGTTYKTKCSVFTPNEEPRYGVSCKLTITQKLASDPVLPSGFRVEIQGEPTVFNIDAACDGRIVMPDGSTNLEAVSKVSDASTGTQLGVGCIEVNAFDDPLTTTTHMMQLAGLQGSPSLFLPRKISESKAGPSIAFVLSVTIAPIVILVLIIVLVVLLTKKKK
jgi:hypothetical protein